MISRENAVIALCAVTGLGVAYGVESATDLPFWVAVAALLGIGVLVPQAVTGRLGERTT